MYRWRDIVTGKEVEVIRKFSEYEEPPTAEEAPDLSNPKWERLVGGNQAITRGPNWSGSKGNWIILLWSLAPLLYSITSQGNW